MAERNLLIPTIPGIASLGDMEKMIGQISRSMGISGLSPTQGNALQIWSTLQELLFSVPATPDSHSWTEEQKDQVMQEYIKKNLGVSKSTFLSMARNKIRATARHMARNKQMKASFR